MKLTNKFSLPEPFVAAVSTDEYVRGDAAYTTTELIKPSRIVALQRKFEAQIEEDVSERVWRLQGQAKHVVFERIAKAARVNVDAEWGVPPEEPRYIIEERFETVMPGGVKISGQIDLFDKKTGILYDWKETSVWKFMLGDTEEWEQQANINVYHMRAAGHIVKAVKNIAILKDWKKREARFGRKKDYPKCAIHVVDLPIWSAGEQQAYILERARLHDEHMSAPPVCTKKERWQRDASFAVMRTDRKRAYRLYDNRDQAEAAMMQQMKIAKPGDAAKFYIEERAAEPVRCLDFCEVQTFCDFGVTAEETWKRKQEEAKHDNDSTI